MGRWGATTPRGATARRPSPCIVFRSVTTPSGPCPGLAVLLLSFRNTTHNELARRKGIRMKSRKYEQPHRNDIHVAPPKKAERQHARPGAGIKRARATMAKKPRSS